MKKYENIALLFLVAPLAAFTLKPELVFSQPLCVERCEAQTLGESTNNNWSITYGVIVENQAGICTQSLECNEAEPCDVSVNCTVKITTVWQGLGDAYGAEDSTGPVIDNFNALTPCPVQKVYPFSVDSCGKEDKRWVTLRDGTCDGLGAVSLETVHIGLECTTCQDLPGPG